MELFEIVMKLNGPVQPLGERHADQTRLANMKTLTKLADRILYEINRAEPAADRVEFYVKAIGVHAREFMESVKNA